MKFNHLVSSALFCALTATATAQGLTNERAVSGLKEALSSGVVSAITKLAAPKGYLSDAAIKILLPPEAQDAAKAVKKYGGRTGQRLMDDLVVRMNTAAEKAAGMPQTKQIFLDAVKGVTLTDGLAILTGTDTTAATRYLQNATLQPLTELYSPTIRTAMTEAGVQNTWTKFAQLYNNVRALSGGQPVPTDISTYITQRALMGMFTAIGREEARIRRDPAARVTTLLKDVFGGIRLPGSK